MSIEIFRNQGENEISQWLEVHKKEITLGCTGTIYVANIQFTEIVSALDQRQDIFTQRLIDRVKMLNGIGKEQLEEKENSWFHCIILTICLLVQGILICIGVRNKPIDIDATINKWKAKEDSSLPAPAHLPLPLPLPLPSPFSPAVAPPPPPVGPPAVVAAPPPAPPKVPLTRTDKIILAIKQGKQITQDDYNFLTGNMPERVNLKGWQFPIHVIWNEWIDSPPEVLFQKFCQDVGYGTYDPATRTNKPHRILVFPVATKEERVFLSKAADDTLISWYGAHKNITFEMEDVPVLDGIEVQWRTDELFKELLPEQLRRFFTINFAAGTNDPKIIENLQGFTKRFFEKSVPYLVENFHHICGPDGTFSPQWNLPELYCSPTSGYTKKPLYALCEELLAQNGSDAHLLAVMRLIGFETGHARGYGDPNQFSIGHDDTFFEKALFIRQNRKDFVFAILNHIMSCKYLQWCDSFFILQTPEAFTDYMTSFIPGTLSPDAKFTKMMQVLKHPGLDATHIQEVLRIAGFSVQEARERLERETKEAQEKARNLPPGVTAEEIQERFIQRDLLDGIRRDCERISKLLDIFEFFQVKLQGKLNQKELEEDEWTEVAQSFDKILNELSDKPPTVHARSPQASFRSAVFEMSNEMEFLNIYKVYLRLNKEGFEFHRLHDFLLKSNAFFQHPDHCKMSKKLAALFTLFWTLDKEKQWNLIYDCSEIFKGNLESQKQKAITVCLTLQRIDGWKFFTADPKRLQALKDMALAIPMFDLLMLNPTNILTMSSDSIRVLIRAAEYENTSRELQNHWGNRDDRFAGNKHPVRDVLCSLKKFIAQKVPLLQALQSNFGSLSNIIYEYNLEYSELWHARGKTSSVDIEGLLSLAPLLENIESCSTVDLVPRLESIKRERVVAKMMLVGQQSIAGKQGVLNGYNASLVFEDAIAAEHPKVETIQKFLDLVHKNQVKVIVQLQDSASETTSLEYTSNSEVNRMRDVLKLEEEQLPLYSGPEKDTTHLSIKTRAIAIHVEPGTHIIYRGWPDQGVIRVTDLVRLAEITHARTSDLTLDQCVLVHCKTGRGNTDLFLLALELFKARKEGNRDEEFLFKLFVSLHRERLGVTLQRPQFELLYDFDQHLLYTKFPQK